MCKCVECPCSNHLLRDGWKQGGRRQGYGIPPWLSDQHLFVVTPSSRPRPGTLPCARWDGQRRHCFLPRPFLLAGHSHSPEVRQSETRCNLNVIYTCIVKSLLQYTAIHFTYLYVYKKWRENERTSVCFVHRRGLG
ncbi:unnamed protein product [Chondrus crispus]|uniref:Uncharacterized protein n=1 Tax=Chondrus crispus TaxID=2769 RepID=R7Q4G7_CHOCR|nr:unnamed protein product [Chondrus crispus]CDF32904.1 unnamed protein product [Chondrus crispus]|eukprot:XP_005712705.1 unnamed protein product [Chondrus crispus]